MIGIRRITVNKIKAGKTKIAILDFFLKILLLLIIRKPHNFFLMKGLAVPYGRKLQSQE